MTDGVKYGKKAIKKGLVLATWKKVVKNEDTLPKDWGISGYRLIDDDTVVFRSN
jgi:hypothetical protein